MPHQVLTAPEEAAQFFAKHPTGTFFKAGGCHKTMQGFGHVQKILEKWSAVPLGIVKVIEYRTTSNAITEITSVVHQSPQLILWKERKVCFDIDNWDITPDALQASFSHHLGNPANASSKRPMAFLSDVENYRSLLQKFTSDEMDEETFTLQWLQTFQMDHSLRSEEEFSLLNSLFGDVDAALAAAVEENKGLKVRAQSLLEQLGG